MREAASHRTFSLHRPSSQRQDPRKAHANVSGVASLDPPSERTRVGGIEAEMSPALRLLEARPVASVSVVRCCDGDFETRPSPPERAFIPKVFEYFVVVMRLSVRPGWPASSGDYSTVFGDQPVQASMDVRPSVPRRLCVRTIPEPICGPWTDLHCGAPLIPKLSGIDIEL